jgi:hypothetical protein
MTYELEVMRQQKSLSKWRSGFRLGLFTDGALNPGIVANRAHVGIAKGSLNAGHSLGRVKERKFGTDFHSCFASINRWCTNAMLARSNARDRVQKLHGPHSELTLAHGLTGGGDARLGHDLDARLMVPNSVGSVYGSITRPAEARGDAGT